MTADPQDRRELAERLAETVGDFLEACGWHWCTECGKFHVTSDRQEDRPEQSKLAVAYNEHRAALLAGQPSEGRERLLCDVLEQAAEWFSEYAEGHAAKGNAEKACRNRLRAIHCRAAIGAAPTPEPAIASKLRDLADAILKTPSISRDEVVERLRLVADDSFPRGNEIPPRKLTEERDGGGTWPTR
jgi:hypothetical protein